MSLFQHLEDMIPASSEAVRPRERLNVAEWAAKYRWLNNPGSYVGMWQNEKTPYMVEPMEEMTSLDYTGMAIVGPARCAKSDIYFNWLGYTVTHDPADMLTIDMTQTVARDWSQGDFTKACFHEGNKKRPTVIGERLVPGRQNDNVHDKKFLSGMRVLVKWPTITELSGKTVPRVWLRDYDRMPANIDKEGNAFDLGRKRTQTYKRYGMTVAESSPGFPVTNSKWEPATPHEAPPCDGLLSIYNRGDRRRWYWRCPQCSAAFEPTFKLLVYPKSNDFMESAEQVKLGCPDCGFPMEPNQQYELNLGGRWLKEGQIWLPSGDIVGAGRRSDIASFWLKGPAAAFTDWPALVLKYLNAESEYEKTGSEESLKVTINVDQGDPYTPKALEAGRLPETLTARAKPYAPKGHVPLGVRFLVTTIDVQAGGRPSFVCHTFGIGIGGDIWHVDTWKIRKSRRLDEDGERKLIDPASYPEDWHILIDEVIERSYPLDDGSGRSMQVKLLACDSGGAASTKNVDAKKKDTEGVVSVTANAYAFWRHLRDDQLGRNHHLRFHLLKGQASKSMPRLHRSFPDSRQKDRFAIARGDVPVWLVNSDENKDAAWARLGRTEPGGQVHFPIWYDAEGALIDMKWLYMQYTAEVKLAEGWRNTAKRKNEAFDLLAYLLAFLLHPDIRIEQMDWANPPLWAAEWDINPLVYLTAEGPTFVEKDDEALTLAELAAQLA